jgi:HSP20 family protein
MFGLIPRNRVKGYFPSTYGPLAPRMELPYFLGNIREEFNKLFEPFMGPTPPVAGWRWNLDVEENEEAVVIRAEAPGFEVGDFELFVHEGYLILSVCHKNESLKKAKTTVTPEWFCREAVMLPPGVIPEKITAVYKNGVLLVTLPRKPEAKGIRVPIAAG